MANSGDRADSCPPFETLHHSKPYCEPTCVQDCSQTPPRNQFLIYDPTCVCLEGYVRHKGACILKQQCPPSEHPQEPCEIKVHRAPRITKLLCQPKPKPPCSKPKQYPPCRTILLRRILKTKQPKPCQNVTVPPCKPTTPVPCKPTTKLYLPPTTKPPPPPPAPPKQCSACERLVVVAPCCEPTCENDCSSVSSCPVVLVASQPTCACQPGLVRHQGHCIEPAACPRSVSRYQLYAPVGTVCARCSGNTIQHGHHPAIISAVPAECNEDHYPSYLPEDAVC
ncbi:keratin-associated protein 16-1-like [Anopheles darlingi]|uniref:keratin-associated protein 16-1-like n=1 Tax=Anopheles darlingi TaxID=43151 RepID=UPI0020FFF918|nr:keratin-associated protein 16-1-like [Anopheles darlingi]